MSKDARVGRASLLLWTSPANFNNSKTAFDLGSGNILMSYKIARYGWLPDLPDERDHFYAAPVELAGVLPAKVDLRPQCPPVYDQGQLGSCTANAIAGAIEFDRMKQSLAQIFTPSRLFIFTTNAPSNTRLIPTAARKFATASRAWAGRAIAPKPSGLMSSPGSRPGQSPNATLTRGNTGPFCISA